ncbi:ABC transporter substrate-binding protein [Candidatus Halobeggiatoa sp. HSG11]|nr:ABC transporter substrate-binding protein [Candidatus Halobeggiatoa sp. HSG11]
MISYTSNVLIIINKFFKFAVKKILPLFILFLLVLTGLRLFLQEEEAIHIAFVGPLSGESEMIGQSMIKAIKLYFEEVNINGGINNLPVVLDVFDDQNNPEQAIHRAREIVEQNQAVAVIGHNCSYCSINGGKIYKDKNIPAITPVSTHLRVTQGNEWYFRTAFNDNLQGNFLANYAKNVLHQNTVTIVQTNVPYGSYLGSIFEQASKELGLEVKQKLVLSKDTNIDEIIAKLKATSDAGLIFLATNANTGVKLVKAIKDSRIKNLLIAPDAYANKKFTEGFKNYFPERRNPGHYTNGIYVSTPFILDTANKYAQHFDSIYRETYQEQPLRLAFYALDAAIVIIEALKQTQKTQSLSIIRNKIKQTITNKFNSFEEAVAGSTGLNYFDKHGNAFKSLSMGVYKSNHLISAFTQLRIAPDYYDDENLLLVDDKRMYKTNVVYAGLQFNKISDFKPLFDGSKSTVSYLMEFHLWLRFQGDIKPHEINFLNAVEPIKLEKPMIDETVGKVSYQLYKVSGQFKESLHSPKERFFANKYSIGINFHHRTLDRNKLIYVTDTLGMEVTDEKAIFAKMKEIQRKTSFFKNWPIQELNFFQGVIKKQILGNPKYIDHGNTVEYSTFNTEIAIGNSAYAYHVIIPNKMSFVFFVTSCLMTIILGLLSYKKLDEQGHYLKYLWFVQVIFALLLLVSAEVLVGKLLLETMDQYKSMIIKTFNILWWLVVAILINIAIERFLWIPLEKNTERKVPNLVRFITALVIYLLACFGIIGFIFEQQFTSMLATGGIVTVLFGLLVQVDLSNIFAGIALSIEDSFHIGNWIKIADYDDGKVVDMNWRVTKIETRTGYILSIPNNVVSTSNIHNFSHPDKAYWLKYIVYVHAEHSPKAVEQVLIEAIFAVETDIPKETPIIWLDEVVVQEVDQWTASYIVFFKTIDYEYKLRVLKNVWQSIWSHLTHAGMMPFKVTPIVYDNNDKVLKNLENMVK